MAKLLKLRRGTTTQHVSFTGAEGEVTIDTTKDTAVVHDGSQAGGRPLAREDMSNVSSASIAGQLGVDSIATDKIAAGALPTDVTVATANLGTTGVTAGAYGSSSAIPIVTVNNKGQVTAASTTAIDSTTIANGTSNVAVANNGDITATRSGTARLVVDDAGVDVTGVITATQNASFQGGCSAQAFTTNNGNVIINSQTPTVSFVDSDSNPDYEIKVNGGIFDIRDSTNSQTRLSVQSNGHVDVAGNLDVGAGIDVISGNVTLPDNSKVTLGTSSDLQLYHDGSNSYLLNQVGNLEFYINSSEVGAKIIPNGAVELYFDNSKKFDTKSTGAGVTGKLDVSNGADITGNLTVSGSINSGAHTVTGNIAVSGTVDGRDVASDGSKLDGIESGATADQTGAEIASALNGQHIRTTAQIGRDSNDHFQFTDNDRLDLYLNGNNEFRFEADGDFHADGDVYAFSTTTASDENLKKDITIVTDAVSKVEAIKGVTFKWKENDGESAGVIAQDVEKVLPEVVKTVANPDGNTYKAVNYAGINSILIEAIKELSARIKVLEAK